MSDITNELFDFDRELERFQTEMYCRFKDKAEQGYRGWRCGGIPSYKLCDDIIKDIRKIQSGIGIKKDAIDIANRAVMLCLRLEGPTR